MAKRQIKAPNKNIRASMPSNISLECNGLPKFELIEMANRLLIARQINSSAYLRNLFIAEVHETAAFVSK